MSSYFAMIWDDECPSASAVASQIALALTAQYRETRRALHQNGFQFYVLSETPLNERLLPVRSGNGAIQGVVFGKIFRKNQHLGTRPREVTQFDAYESERILDSGGSDCVTSFWGNYVTFIRKPNAGFALSSPSCATPLFYQQKGGVTFAFSHLEDCSFLDRSQLTVNIGFLRKLLAYDRIQNGETGLNEITELMGGERLAIKDGSLRTDVLWDPREVASSKLLPPLPQAKEELRNTIQSSVQAWGGTFTRVAVDLSGGLDSSIVLSCLARSESRPELMALHHRPKSGDASEAAYAQATAQFLDVDFQEVSLEPSDALPQASEHPPSARPYRHFLARDFALSLGDEVAGFADVFFTGQGGDHLFYASKSPFRFADYLRVNGIDRGIAHELFSSARLSQTTIWDTLAKCLPVLVRYQSASGMTQSINRRRNAVNDLAYNDLNLDSLLPGWATQPLELPPAKFDQISDLIHLFQVREPFALQGTRTMLHPLISQPLIELCLRLPVHLLTPNGQSRGLVRMAFAGLIPDVVRTRMTKGNASQYFQAQVTSNKHQILEALLNGELVRLGLIEREAIEEYFFDPLSRHLEETRSIFICYAIESWLRSWKRISTENTNERITAPITVLRPSVR